MTKIVFPMRFDLDPRSSVLKKRAPPEDQRCGVHEIANEEVGGGWRRLHDAFEFRMYMGRLSISCCMQLYRVRLCRLLYVCQHSKNGHPIWEAPHLQGTISHHQHPQ